MLGVNSATNFQHFQQLVSGKIPGLDPQQFNIVIVCSRAGAPEARQHIPIHENTVRGQACPARVTLQGLTGLPGKSKVPQERGGLPCWLAERHLLHMDRDTAGWAVHNSTFLMHQNMVGGT